MLLNFVDSDTCHSAMAPPVMHIGKSRSLRDPNANNVTSDAMVTNTKRPL